MCIVASDLRFMLIEKVQNTVMFVLFKMWMWFLLQLIYTVQESQWSTTV